MPADPHQKPFVANAARRLRWIAAAILAIGGALAVAAYVFASRAVDVPEVGPGSISEKREMQQLERLGGKAAVVTLRFQQVFESLFRGERLAVTLATLSVLAAWLCLHLASLADEDTPDPDEPGQ